MTSRTAFVVMALLMSARPLPAWAGSREAQDVAPRVHWLVFVDDLHLDFPGTGRIRDLLRAVASSLVLETDLVSVGSSGPSGLDVQARAGAAALADAAKRVTGNGLKDEDTVRPPAGHMDEVAYRTRTALTAAAAFVESAGPAPGGERRVLLYLSRGYDLQRPGGPDEVGAAALELLELAAARAAAVIIALEPERMPAAAVTATQPRVAAALQARRKTLRSLVVPSQGFFAQDTVASRPTLLGQMAALVGR